MKLEMEQMTYDRKEFGHWAATFTVRDEKDRELFRFQEDCSGSERADQIFGWQQSITAEQAMALLFSQARARLKKVASIA